MLIRIGARADAEAFELGDRIVSLLAGNHPGVVLVRSEFVGPAVGEVRVIGIFSSTLDCV